MPSLLEASAGFADALRAAGLGVGVADTRDFVRALTLLDVGRRADVRDASRALFCRRHEDLATHDVVFDAYWHGQVPRARMKLGQDPARQGESEVRMRESPRTPGEAARDDADSQLGHASYSPDETLRSREFEKMTPDELRQANATIAALAPTIERGRTRRVQSSERSGRLALRRTLRRSLATGGELVDPVFTRPRLAARPITLLIDVSGSMQLHARLMLRFACVLRRVDTRTEVFVFGTRLTRVTRQVAARDPDVALENVARVVEDWSGGTRIGDSVRSFNRRWARRTAARNGTVLILSDGWDRGDSTMTAAEIQRLRRNCRRLIWLNPLAATRGFEPLAGGMAAALPSLDLLLPAGTLHDLETLARLLADTRCGRRERPPEWRKRSSAARRASPSMGS